MESRPLSAADTGGVTYQRAEAARALRAFDAPRALALLVGAAFYALAMPPYDASFLAWVALVPLLLAVNGRSVAFGMVYGAVYGLACAWGVAGWLAWALARYFGLGLPAGILVASVYALVYWGSAFAAFAGGAVVLSRSRWRAATWLGIPALWVTTELFRGRVMAQPWGLLGYSQHAEPALIQIAAITAVYGVSFVLVLGNVAVVEAVRRFQKGTRVSRLVKLIVFPTTLTLFLVAAGAIVANHGPVGGFGAKQVVLVQPNVAPAFVWTPAYTDRQIGAALNLTRADSHETALVVWPEHAVPRYLEHEPQLAALLAAIAKRNRADLLFGAPRYEAGRTFNSVRLITASGRSGGTYDKQRLVLFAEANPLRSETTVQPEQSPQSFTAGTGPSILRSFVRLGPSICHEILFPELIADSVAAGADVLVNVSNDGWLDGGSGIASRQHFAMAAFRAVESRRYVIRAATTGVSGIIDPYGRVVASLPTNTSGVVTASVAGRTGLTMYARVGDAFAIGCLVGTLVLFAPLLPAQLRRRHPQLVPASRTIL